MGILSMIYRNIEGIGIIGGMIGMIGVTVLQILGRMMNVHVPWTIETNRYLLIYVSFLGLSEATKRQEHIGTEFLQHSLSPRNRFYVWFIIQILFLIFSIFVVYSGFAMVLMHHDSNQMTVSLPFNFSIAYISIILPIGFILNSLHLIALINRSLREVKLKGIPIKIIGD